MRLKDRLDETLKLLLSESGSLKELAAMSSFEPFTFYNGANLESIDLSGQDLTGLNFDGADLLGANLSNVRFDPGAFNNAKTDQANLTDEYDCYATDLLFPVLHEHIYVFCRFRESTFDEYLSETNLTLKKIAELSKISTATLRKARLGETIAINSAVNIADTVESERNQRNNLSRSKQPMLAFYKLLNNGGFKRLPRKEMLRVIELASLIARKRYPSGRPSHLWRQGPETITWLAGYYMRGEDLPVWLQAEDEPTLFV